MKQDELSLQMSAEDEPGDLVKMAEFANTVFRYRWYVLTIFAASLVIGVFYAATQKDMYKSSCSILIDSSKSQVNTYRESAAGTAGGGENRGLIDTQLVIATSMPVLLEAAKLTDAKTYFGASSDQQAAVSLKKNVSSFQYKKTNIFYIEVVDPDPKWAAKFANAVADKFLQESMRQNLKGNQELLKMLPGDMQSDPAALMQKMSDPHFIESLPSVQQSASIQELKKEKLRLIGEIAQLKIRYTNENPVVVEAEQTAKNIDHQINEETAGIIAGLKRSLTSEFNSSNMSIFEQAKPAAAPFAPNRTMIVVMFGAGGLMIAFMLCALMGTLIITVNGEEDLARLANIPYLGHMPLLDEKTSKNAAIQDLMDIQSMRDSIAMLHTALVFSMPKDRSKLIMLTSCIPGEGKSTVTAMLAFTMAVFGRDTHRKQSDTDEKVLLIEADIRRPGVSHRINLKGGDQHAGLSDYLTGSATFDKVLQNVPGHSNLDVITAGTNSKNPEALFSSKMFDELIKTAEQRYARVIFDSPPFLSIPEASIISQKMHGTVFVIGCGLLKRKVLLRAIEKFKLLNTTLYGTVLNRLNTDRKSHYHGYKYTAKSDKRRSD